MILGSTCTSQSGPIEGGGGPDVRPQTSSQGHRSALWRCQRHPFPPNRATPGPPASWLKPGSPLLLVTRRTLQRRQPPETAARSHAPFPRVSEISCSKSSPAADPSPTCHQQQLELRLILFGYLEAGRERETEKLIPTGGLKLPQRSRILRLGRSIRNTCPPSLQERKAVRAQVLSPARTNPSAVSNTGTNWSLPLRRQACKT